MLELLARQKDLNFTPGERHLYSNSGYTLLAVIVSRASGKSFREFTTERIFKPLGMTNTHFRDNFTEIVKGQAYGYARAGRAFRLSVTNFDTAGATSLMTTVEDLAKWHANFDTGKVGGGSCSPACSLAACSTTAADRLRVRHHARHVSRGADGRPRWRRRRIPRRIRPLPESALRRRDAVQPRHGESRRARRGASRRCFSRPARSRPPRNRQLDASVEVPLPKERLSRYPGLYWNQADSVVRRFALDEPAGCTPCSAGSGFR